MTARNLVVLIYSLFDVVVTENAVASQKRCLRNKNLENSPKPPQADTQADLPSIQIDLDFEQQENLPTGSDILGLLDNLAQDPHLETKTGISKGQRKQIHWSEELLLELKKAHDEVREQEIPGNQRVFNKNGGWKTVAIKLNAYLATEGKSDITSSERCRNKYEKEWGNRGTQPLYLL